MKSNEGSGFSGYLLALILLVAIVGLVGVLGILAPHGAFTKDVAANTRGSAVFTPTSQQILHEGSSITDCGGYNHVVKFSGCCDEGLTNYFGLCLHNPDENPDVSSLIALLEDNGVSFNFYNISTYKGEETLLYSHAVIYAAKWDRTTKRLKKLTILLRSQPILNHLYDLDQLEELGLPGGVSWWYTDENLPTHYTCRHRLYSDIILDSRIQSLRNLKHLDLSFTILRGLQNIEGLPLEELRLVMTQVKDMSLPDVFDMVTTFSSMKELWLSYIQCPIDGNRVVQLPHSITNLHNLEILFLDSVGSPYTSYLGGNLPDLRSLTKLHTLVLFNNELTGYLRVPSSIKYVNVALNRLRGSLYSLINSGVVFAQLNDNKFEIDDAEQVCALADSRGDYLNSCLPQDPPPPTEEATQSGSSAMS